MHPELLRIGPVVISSYGILLALAFIFSIAISRYLAQKRGVPSDEIINLALVIMISSILGARLLYVLFHLDEFQGRWVYTIVPIQRDGTIGLSGLILLGGIWGAVLAGTFYVRKKRLPVWKITDSIAPALAFGIFLGRIGCFLNGCCFGKSCDLSWGITFPPHSYAAAIMGPVPLHPTQLYSSLYALGIFLFLMFLERRQRYDGFLSGLFLILYGVGRFLVDFFRYYESQMFIPGGITLNQWISLLMILGGGIVLYIKHPAKKNIVKSQ